MESVASHGSTGREVRYCTSTGILARSALYVDSAVKHIFRSKRGPSKSLMPAYSSSEVKFEIRHILFIDI